LKKLLKKLKIKAMSFSKPMMFQLQSPNTLSLYVSQKTVLFSLAYLKNEGVFTNRAMAYIKQRKYKEALLDCE
jgi:hypothetical protein